MPAKRTRPAGCDCAPCQNPGWKRRCAAMPAPAARKKALEEDQEFGPNLETFFGKPGAFSRDGEDGAAGSPAEVPGPVASGSGTQGAAGSPAEVPSGSRDGGSRTQAPAELQEVMDYLQKGGEENKAARAVKGLLDNDGSAKLTEERWPIWFRRSSAGVGRERAGRHVFGPALRNLAGAVSATTRRGLRPLAAPTSPRPTARFRSPCARACWPCRRRRRPGWTPGRPSANSSRGGSRRSPRSPRSTRTAASSRSRSSERCGRPRNGRSCRPSALSSFFLCFCLSGAQKYVFTAGPFNSK